MENRQKATLIKKNLICSIALSGIIYKKNE